MLNMLQIEAQRSADHVDLTDIFHSAKSAQLELAREQASGAVRSDA